MLMASSRNRLFLVAGLVAVAVLVAVTWAALARAQDGGTGSQVTPAAATPAPQPAAADGDSGIAYEGPSGIWVNGTGKASGAPDIAVISLGVEALEDTAAEARAEAAKAMADVMAVLTEAEIPAKDIQTSYFNISPRFQGVEVQRCDDDEEGDSSAGTSSWSKRNCYDVWENRLIGYSVSNQASVKIRDLEDAGTIIDQVTEAAGDLVRIQGISFDIDDPQPLRDEARENAVADMKRKAELLAELSGVDLGRLVYVNEQAGYVPPQPLYARAESMAFAADAGAATSISGGELEYRMTVAGVFLIAEPEG